MPADDYIAQEITLKVFLDPVAVAKLKGIGLAGQRTEEQPVTIEIEPFDLPMADPQDIGRLHLDVPVVVGPDAMRMQTFHLQIAVQQFLTINGSLSISDQPNLNLKGRFRWLGSIRVDGCDFPKGG